MKKVQKLLAAMLTVALCALGLVGCVSTTDGGGANSTPAAAPESTGTPAADDTPAGYTAGEEVTLRIVDWSDSALAPREEFHKLFEEKHPGVTIEYTCLTVDEFNSSIINMIISGDGPDLFPIPSNLSLPVVQKENWYQPMDAFVTDEFMATIEEDMLMEGVTHLNSELYVLPEQMPITNMLMFYNQDVLDAAGVTQLPETYSEFIDVCQQITQAGQGQYYGLVEGGNQLGRVDALIRGLTARAGGKIPVAANYALTVDGRAPFDTPEVKEAFGLLTKLYADGSIHPDTLNINAPVAREYFAQGQAAFLTQGMWCVGAWANSDPDLNYGVMNLPVPDGVSGTKLQQNQVAGWMGIYSQTKVPELCGEYLMCMYDPEYGYQPALVQSGAYLSITKGVNDANMESPVMKEYYRLGMEEAVTVPFATVRSADVFDFYAEVIDVNPNMPAILTGVWAGTVSNYEDVLAKYADDTTAEWQRASEAIGLDYSVFEFDNWTAGVPYTEADYAALD